MKQQSLTEVEGYRLLGEALGTGAITSTVANVAFTDWKTPRHEEFAEHNLYNLYQGVTEGLKLVGPANRMGAQTRAHSFFHKKATV